MGEKEKGEEKMGNFCWQQYESLKFNNEACFSRMWSGPGEVRGE